MSPPCCELVHVVLQLPVPAACARQRPGNQLTKGPPELAVCGGLLSRPHIQHVHLAAEPWETTAHTSISLRMVESSSVEQTVSGPQAGTLQQASVCAGTALHCWRSATEGSAAQTWRTEPKAPQHTSQQPSTIHHPPPAQQHGGTVSLAAAHHSRAPISYSCGYRMLSRAQNSCRSSKLSTAAQRTWKREHGEGTGKCRGTGLREMGNLQV